MSDAIPEKFMTAAENVLGSLSIKDDQPGKWKRWCDRRNAIARALMAAAKEADEAATKRERERMPIGTAVVDVLAERERQKSGEGWTDAHDDQHQCGELAEAAVCYALQGSDAGSIRTIGGYSVIFKFWPWGREWWKPTTRRRNLVKAAALILAEIERLDRAAIIKGEA